MKNNMILSGRYELLRHLGDGADSTVYLARHTSLTRECAVKIYPKNRNTSLCILSEAQLLRSLHHPSIPKIYDIEEDADHYYLVEEFIPGESLEEFLSHQESVSQSLFFTFCEQLCDVFDYLHSQTPEPVIYQDLKPEHLILCNGQLKLIDFGDSHAINNSGKSYRQRGNLDFSAPECISGRSITIASDIYSIGKLMEYLSDYTENTLTHDLRRIIQKATSPDPASRYQTVQALALAINHYHHTYHSAHLLRTIAVVGAARGCGATHLSIALVSALNAMGFPCCYYEKNESCCIEKMASHQKNIAEQADGSYSYRHFKGFPQYGPGIRISHPDTIALEDYGTDIDSSVTERTDLILVVCPDALWHRDDVIAKTKLLSPYGNRMRLLCNPGRSEAARFYARQTEQPVFRYFYDSDPFRVDNAKEHFTRQLLDFPEKGRVHKFCSFIIGRKS